MYIAKRRLFKISSQKNRILVTGGAGFIGSNLVARLRKENEVIVIDNLSFGRKENILEYDDVVLNKVDLLDKDKIEKILLKFQPNVVYHLGALHYIPYCNENPTRTVKVNLLGTHLLLETMRKIKVKKFVFASTAAIYRNKSTACKETDEVKPMDIYGYSKTWGEELINFYFTNYLKNVSCYTFRFFNVYGPRETNPHLIPHVLEQMKKGKIEIQLGNLTPLRDYIYVDDVVEALRKILEIDLPRVNILNLGTGRGYSVKHVVSMIKKVTKKDLKIRQNKKLMRKVDRQFLIADISKVKNKINWTPRYNFVKGIEELTRSEGIIK